MLEDEQLEAEFACNIFERLTGLEENISSSNTEAVPVQNPQVPLAASCVSAPKLQCVKFNGIRADKFEFRNFLVQFENCGHCTLEESQTVAFLKFFLTSYASQLVSHLSLEDENFEVAFDLLKKGFLGIPFITDEIFKQLLGSSPKYDPKFVNIKSFLSEIKAELKTSYNLDFFEENTPGYELLSYIIFSKLPPTLQKELIRKINSNCPKINHIFDSYNEVIKTLIKTGFKKN